MDSGMLCSYCGQHLDAHGSHCLSCVAGRDATTQHNGVQDVYFGFCGRARVRRKCGCMTWVDRVASASKLADCPSRLNFGRSKDTCHGRIKVVPPLDVTKEHSELDQGARCESSLARDCELLMRECQDNGSCEDIIQGLIKSASKTFVFLITRIEP